MTDLPLETLIDRGLALWDRSGGEVAIPGFRLASATAPAGPIHGAYEPSLVVVLQGAKISRVGTRVFRYDAGKCLITSLDVPVRAEIVEASPARPYLALILRIEAGVVAELLLDHARGDLPAVQTAEAIGVHPLAPVLIDPLERLLALGDHPQDSAVLGPMIRREILWRLLNGPQGPMLRQVGLAESRLARLARSIGWVRDHFAQALSVSHLARLAGMSPATFHRHFKAATGMTPVQFQKSLRLQEARRLLLSEAADVAQVGFAVGYESPSQFSRDYRRMFGAPPGRDGREIRRRVAPAVSA